MPDEPGVACPRSLATAGAPATILQYRSLLERLNETFGASRLADVRPSHVSDYVTKTSTKLAAASVGRDLSILHAIFEWAVALELVDRNPTRGVARPTVRVAFLTFVLTGLRRSELQALQWRDVDLIENRLRVVDSKTDTGIARSPSAGPRGGAVAASSHDRVRGRVRPRVRSPGTRQRLRLRDVLRGAQGRVQACGPRLAG